MKYLFIFKNKMTSRSLPYILIYCFIIIILPSCSHRNEDSHLLAAERLMDEYPDSALVILESFSPEDFTDDENRALYGLLYTQALDKNHLCPTNDSIIRLAVDHYQSDGNVLRLVLSNYYQGRVLYNAGNNPMAIVSFFKAKELAENNGMDFWAGMACRGISDIYNDTYNSAEELAFAEMEYELIKKSGRQPYLNYALNDLGKALYNNGDHEHSISISKQLTDSADKYDDPYLYTCARNLMAYNLMYMENYDEAYPILSEICDSGYAEMQDSLNLCLAMIQTGRSSDIIAKIDTVSDRTFTTMLRYELAKNAGDCCSALKELQYVDSVTDIQFREAMSHNLTSTLVNYFELHKRLDRSEILSSRMRLLIVILATVLILALICGGSLFIYHRQNMRISEKVLIANQLQEELNNVRKENSNSASIIRSLMTSKYELLEDLSTIMLQSTDSRIARRKIADHVTKIIDDMSIRSDKIVSLENKVNLLFHNLMTDFRNELPGLKDADYLLFLFSVMGLSAATISLLLKEDKIESVYNRKRRLKNKIRQLAPSLQEKFLYFMN